MRIKKKLLAAVVVIAGIFVTAHAKHVAERDIPAPQMSSQALQQKEDADAPDIWKADPQTAEDWKRLVHNVSKHEAEMAKKLIGQFQIQVKETVISDVKAFELTPPALPKGHQDKVLLHIHGGGYVFHPGYAALPEAALAAGISGYKVVSVDYRMPPDFPYPAALDDVMAVYRALLKTYPAEKIGVFGTSTGGGMTLALVLRAKQENLPLPGAIAPGTPWSDMTKTGDSYFTNEGIDNLLVSYDGWLKQAAELYANGHDLKDPMLSPVYGDVTGFPPTFLTSGTRDLFLSNTVRMHQKLRQAGVKADLMVFEGMSHAMYYLLPPEAPETAFHFKELGRFFDENLK